MKRCFLLFSLLAGLLFSAFAVEKNRFERVQRIDGVFAAGQRGRLALSSAVFGQARDFPADLRIISSDGIQWPFFLVQPETEKSPAILEHEILNRSWVAGPEPYLQFDLIVRPAGRIAPVHNWLELKTSGRDYIRRVEVFAGGAEARGRIASGFLIDFSRQKNAQNRRLRYPDSDAARLHVQIYPNARSATETFSLLTVSLGGRAPAASVREAVAFTGLNVPAREQKKEASVRIFDLGETNRPVEFISFDVLNGSFARSVSVAGRNTDREPWRWVGGGEIHRLNGDLQNTVKLHSESRMLKVELFHYDDSPLSVRSVKLEAAPRYLVFEAASSGSASLYFRAWDMSVPRYDLKDRISAQEIAALPRVRTSVTSSNDAVRIPFMQHYARLIGWLAVGAVSLLVIRVIVSMLKEQIK